MIAGSWTIPLVTSYLPHDLHAADSLHQTRLFRGPLVRFLAADHLYHLEHHLYPAVPHQNWPLLARRLDPWFAAMGLQPVRIGWPAGR
jgi:beta-carotene hydroxylase